MTTLECVQTCLNDLLGITKARMDDHLAQPLNVPIGLQEVDLRVNIPKSKFCAEEGVSWVQSHQGLSKPKPNKLQAICALT